MAPPSDESSSPSSQCRALTLTWVEKMMERKTSPCSAKRTGLASLVSKRRKIDDLSLSSKDGKDRLSAKIVALQQLVSPFGKTDTASVLSEATEYIQFLHEQVKVLSAAYLKTAPAAPVQGWLESYSLRSRGLCLIPVSYTTGVARNNGADLWAPIKSASQNLGNPASHFHRQF